ncbi:MAG: tetratricopeptide repeat protein [Acidobacteriota bacterium]
MTKRCFAGDRTDKNPRGPRDHRCLALGGRLDRAVSSIRISVLWIFLSGTQFVANGSAQDSAAVQHANRAQQMAQRGDLVNAEAEMRRALDLSPNRPRYLSALGSILGMQKKLEEANTYFEKSLKLDPGDLATRRSLVANQWQLGRLQEARENLQHLLKSNPADRQAMLLMGLISESLADYAQAIKWLKAVPDLVQKDPQSVLALARAYYQIKQTRNARETLAWLRSKEASSQDLFMGGKLAAESDDLETAEQFFSLIESTYPDQLGLGYNAALLRFRKGQFAAAQQKLESLAASKKVNADVFNLLGWCYYRQQQILKAGQAFETAINLEPNKESNYLDMAQALSSEQRFRSTALDVVGTAGQRFPKSSRVHEVKGDIQFKMHRYADAIESYQRSLQLDGSSSTANLGLAKAQWLAGQTREAALTFERGIRDFPRDAAHYQEYAIMLLKLEEESGKPPAGPPAVSLLQTAIQLDSSLSEARYQLGNLALLKEDYEEALKHLEAAVRLDPRDSKIHFALARLYRRLKRSEEAAKETELFQKLLAEEEKRLGAPTSKKEAN